MPFTTETQGLETLQEQPSVERTHAGAQVTHGIHSKFSGERFVAVSGPKPHAMVPLRGVHEAGEFAIRPIEFSTVDDDTAHAGAVAANPFRAAVRDDICAEREWLADVAAHSKCVVNDYGDPSFVCDFCYGGYIGDIELRVSDGLEINRPRFVIDSSSDVFRILTLDKFDVDVEFLEIDTKLIVRPTVKPSGADEIEARFANSRYGHKLRRKINLKARCGWNNDPYLSRMTRRRSNGSYTAFEHAHTSFENGVGRISHASIDVAVLGPSKLARAIISVAEVV